MHILYHDGKFAPITVDTRYLNKVDTILAYVIGAVELLSEGPLLPRGCS